MKADQESCLAVRNEACICSVHFTGATCKELIGITYTTCQHSPSQQTFWQAAIACNLTPWSYQFVAHKSALIGCVSCSLMLQKQCIAITRRSQYKTVLLLCLLGACQGTRKWCCCMTLSTELGQEKKSQSPVLSHGCQLLLELSFTIQQQTMKCKLFCKLCNLFTSVWSCSQLEDLMASWCAMAHTTYVAACNMSIALLRSAGTTDQHLSTKAAQHINTIRAVYSMNSGQSLTTSACLHLIPCRHLHKQL